MNFRWAFGQFQEDHNCNFKGNTENDQNRMNLSEKSNSINVEQHSNANTSERLFEDRKFLEFCEGIIKYIRPEYR